MKGFSFLRFCLFVLPAYVAGQPDFSPTEESLFVKAGFQPSPYQVSGYVNWKNEKIYDTAFLRIRYRMTFRNQYRTEIDNDHRIVEIGHAFRKDYSERLDTVERANRIRYAQGYSTDVHTDSTVYPAEWFTAADGRSWCSFRTLYPGPILRFEDGTASFQWQLIAETDSIFGYVCQKAETRFNGRKYEAWYCPEIPVDAGPYKFGGLPGLILQIVDTAGDYAWEVIGIEKGRWPVSEKQFVFQACSRKQGRSLIENMFAHPFSFLTHILKCTIVFADSKGGHYFPGENEFAVSYYYRPIELE